MEMSLFYQQITAWIVLISVFMFVLPKISHRFSMPGSFAIAISFPIALGIYSVYGIGLHITSYMAVLVACIVFILIISTILSDRPDMAIKHLIIYSGAVFLGMAFASNDVWTIIIVAAVFHSIFICIPLKITTNAGFLGNPNFAGTFLAPCVFIAYYSDHNIVAIALILSLIKTRCRGAMIGLIMGSLFISFIPAIALSVLLFGSIFRCKTKSYETLKARLGLWKSTFKFLTIKRFLIGVGGDVGRISFMKDRGQENRNRRLHSDIIQGIFDGGIFYVILYLWIGIYSVVIAPPALAAALLSLMIAGLFIDTRLVHFTSVLFWVMVGQINYSAAPAVVVAPWMLGVAIPLFVLAANTWGRAFIADAIHGIAFLRGDSKRMVLAHKINPADDLATASLVGAMILSKQHGPAFHNAWRLVDRYDGDLQTEIPYYLMALASFNVGAYPISSTMAQQCLVYCDHSGAKQLLNEIDRLAMGNQKKTRKGKRKKRRS